MTAKRGIGASCLRATAPALILVLLAPPQAGHAGATMPDGRIFFSACPELRDGGPLPLEDDDTCAVTSSELYSMDPAGNERTRLTDNDAFEQDVLASPGRRRLVLTLSPDESCDPFAYDFDGSLATMAIDGSDLKRLTSRSDHRCDHATDWSPHLSRILFTRTGALGTNVMTIRTKTRQVTAVTDFDYESPDSGQWMGDDRHVMLTAPGKTTYDIFVSRADGSQRRALRTDNLYEREIEVSANGRWVAFNAQSRDGGIELYVMRPDGTSRTRLTFSPDLGESSIEWSPDGRSLLFQAFDDQDGSDSYISTVRRNGSGFRMLTTSDEEFDRAWDAYWSPDGERIAFVGERFQGDDAVFAVYVMNSDGSDKRRLTEWDQLTWLWGWIAPPAD